MSNLVNLSPEQTKAFDEVMAFMGNADQKYYVLAGYAGAGKTSLARVIDKKLAEDGKSTIFAAYTGKAVNVLREKGISNVTTIHAGIYKASKHDKGELLRLQGMQANFLAEGNGHAAQSLQFDIERIEAEHRKPLFVMGDGKGFSDTDLVIIDEYSMLDEKVIGDILAVAKKVLFMGDPFQLPPVKRGSSPDGQILRPNFFITEIHRQALESSIVRFSKDIREGRMIPYGDHGDLQRIATQSATVETYTGADQVICGRNATRTGINNWFRSLQGFGPLTPFPCAGEKIICLKNNKDLGIFNGMITTAFEDAHKQSDNAISYILKAEGILDDNGLPQEISVWEGDVLGAGDKYSWNDFKMRSLNRFDFAYAITCHKSQGSEFNNVVVMNEPIGENAEMERRWIYTAITRGKKGVRLVG